MEVSEQSLCSNLAFLHVHFNIPLEFSRKMVITVSIHNGDCSVSPLTLRQLVSLLTAFL